MLRRANGQWPLAYAAKARYVFTTSKQRQNGSSSRANVKVDIQLVIVIIGVVGRITIYLHYVHNDTDLLFH